MGRLRLRATVSLPQRLLAHLLIALGLAIPASVIAGVTVAAHANFSTSPIVNSPTSAATLRLIRRMARPLRGESDDYDALLQRVGDARLVLLGEDTHGSLEIYRERARITQRLMAEKGFNALVIEADWQPTSQVDRYVRGLAGDTTALQALSGYTRFPVWMWRNLPFRDLVVWLRHYNLSPAGQRRPVGVYGMDSQNLATSAEGLLATLARIDPDEAARARENYACLERFEFNGDRYGAALQKDQSASCEAVTASVFDAVSRRFEAQSRTADSDWFSALQSARAVRAAEAYVRAQVNPKMIAWNVRDQHMADAVDVLLARLEKLDGRPAKMVIWAHNTHVGDARATDRGMQSDYWNIGQLLRERHPDETFVVGFTTRIGTVRAAPFWGEPDRVYNIQRPAWESVPAIFGRVRISQFMLLFEEDGATLGGLDASVPQRAIGVVYWPKFERREHYYGGRLTEQFDAVIHLDRTQALPRLP